MFENETQKILNCYKESSKVLKKLHDIVKPYEYNQPKHDNVFYTIIPSLHSFNSLEYDVHRALSNILSNHNIRRIPGGKPTYYYSDTKITINQHIKNIKSITIDDFYYNALYYETYNAFRGYDRQSITIDKNIYEDKRAGQDGMYLILNCIWLLDNPEPITWEQRQAIWQALKNSNTFIFKGCKVTSYNNGRLIVKFSDSELFTRFKNKAAAATKAINKELNQEAKVCND